MIILSRSNSSHLDFIRLVELLDKELVDRDGDLNEFYHQYNGIESIKYVIVAHKGEVAVGCGAIKAYDKRTVEVKRMYTPADYRGQGIASKILKALEDWAAELDYKRCILETGKGQPEAIALYKKCGYQITDNYGQYADVENSVCFEKLLD